MRVTTPRYCLRPLVHCTLHSVKHSTRTRSRPALPPARSNARSVPAPGVLLAEPCAGRVGGGTLTALLPELARVLRRCAAARALHAAQERSTFADTYAFDECATTTLACLDPTILHTKPDDRDDEYPEASYQRPRKFSYMRQV